MGDSGDAAHPAAGQSAALRLRLDGAGILGRVHLRRQRIHLGAHEAAGRAVDPVDGCDHSHRAPRGLRRARAAGLLTGLILIPALFYTYPGICGKSVDVVNVLIFQAAVLAAWLVSRGLQRRGSLSAPLWQVLGILVQLGAAAVFAVWTVSPPELPLFVDPTNGTRGV